MQEIKAPESVFEVLGSSFSRWEVYFRCRCDGCRQFRSNSADLLELYETEEGCFTSEGSFAGFSESYVPEHPAFHERSDSVIKEEKVHNEIESLEDLQKTIPKIESNFQQITEDTSRDKHHANENGFNSSQIGKWDANRVMDSTFASAVLQEVCSHEGQSFSAERSELLLGDQQEVQMEYEVSRRTVGTALSSSLVSFKEKQDERKDKATVHSTAEDAELQVLRYSGLSKFVSQDLYTFFEQTRSGDGSLSAFEGRRSKSNKEVSSPSMNVSALHQKHFSSSMKGFVESSGLTRNKRKDYKNHDNTSSRLTFPNGTHVKDNSESPQFLRTYHRLLRDERLVDCLELLENVEKEGLLDMDKVYHARFFNTCKSKKAVKEAFRFAKLIKNPTLSTFNMLLSVCAISQDFEGAFQVFMLVKEAGLKPDCKLYTTLISTCAKSGKVDAMFEVFHEMVNSGIEPNVHTYGALIDGCARAGQVAKAFGAYGILRSKNVKPDRVIFNALITACGQSGAVDRAFDVLAEMRAEPTPIDPDHVTVGALMKTCMQAGEIDRAREVYQLIKQYKIKGTPDVYTIAVNICSEEGDLEFALDVYNDMKRNGVAPDEMFLSSLIDVAGHAGKVETAFDIIKGARFQGVELGNISYSSLMGACSNSKNWQKAVQLYQDMKDMKLLPTVSTVNALITSLCDADQLQRSLEILGEVKQLGVRPNEVTYTILLMASEKKDDLELGLKLLSEAKKDGITSNLVMCRCLIGLCVQRFEKAYSLGESILSFSSGKLQLNSKWTSCALMVYRETIDAGVIPSMEVFSQVIGCLQLPHDTSFRSRLVQNLGISNEASKQPNIYSLHDGFGEYDPRAFSLLEEAASLGIVPHTSFKESPIVFDARKLQIHTAKVYLLTILKGLRHRLAAGAKLPNVTILLRVEKTEVVSPKGNKMVALAGRVGRAISAMLRRLGLPYQGKASLGKIRISGLALRRWFQPKLSSSFSGKPAQTNFSQPNLARRIADQQRNIRNRNLTIE
ncbi:pentatricopeptide repeat-containing protein MRL1, chloroplastic isoform X2 [Aristolochia californica]|uniref:pentatricopeptide repeat-containing protein MRL1, chloroplastic isoform X2 n=1 Tax=Aristolochia californica TaxID=171875 RepID=UPI0035DFFB5C